MLDLVGNPEDRFSHNEAHICLDNDGVMVAELPPLGKKLLISEPYVLKADSIVVDIHVCFVVVFTFSRLIS